jgi:hypothetical protein
MLHAPEKQRHIWVLEPGRAVAAWIFIVMISRLDTAQYDQQAHSNS